jgi:serine/threonine protein kinase
MELIKRGDFEFDDDAWGDISDEAKDLISQIFQDESNRITAKKCLSHPWMQKFLSKSKKGNILEAQIKRLREFQNKTKFRKAVLTYLSTRVSDDDVLTEK